MTDEIRRALDARLAALEGSPERRAQIRAQAMRHHAGEQRMRRKLSVALIVVMAVLLGGTAFAAGLGLNLFEYFGKMSENWPERAVQWADLAEQAVLETEAPVTVTHEVLGEAEAVITNAYYDGQQLTVAFAIQEGLKIDRWAPTEEQKAELVLDPRSEPRELVTDDFVGQSQSAIRNEILETVAAGQPVGYSIRLLYAGQLTANGIPAPFGGGGRKIQEDGAYYEITEYLAPLRDEVRKQEELDLRIPILQSAAFYWFDGSEWYMRYEPPQEVNVMTASVRRSDNTRWDKRYEGMMTRSDGVVVGVEACFRDETLEVIMTADEPGLPFLWETEFFEGNLTSHIVKLWSISGLYDEKGEQLRCGSPGSDGRVESGENYLGDNQMEHLLGYSRRYRFEGEMPESIRVELDGWESEGESASILLLPVE